MARKRFLVHSWSVTRDKTEGKVKNMIFADKIILQRKKSGWSQEELAEKMGVSRQAVSKWEGAQSVPDLEKVLRLASLFGVTTDYLLKDEIEDAEYIGDGGEVSSLYSLSLEEADEYLNFRIGAAPRLALGIAIFVLSLIPLIILSTLGAQEMIPLGEDPASALGASLSLLTVLAGLVLVIPVGQRRKDFAFLNRPFETAYGVSGAVRERRRALKPAHRRMNLIGISLCVLSALPLFAASYIDNKFYEETAIVYTFALVAAGVYFIVKAGVGEAALDLIADEGTAYSKEIESSAQGSRAAAIYWPLVTALYLSLSFLTRRWDRTWIIWVAAGVAFPGVEAIFDK